MNVPFVDLHAQYLSIKSEIDAAIAEVIKTTAFIRGPYVAAFEQEYAKHYGFAEVVSMANGTDTLYVSLKMLGVGPGDEVITAANSWISSSEVIGQLRATPVFVDIDEYYTLDVEQLERAVSGKTKAIIPVHLFGQMADMDAVMKIADSRGIPVIEDCAQSHYAEQHGRRAGTIGLAGSYSFYPGKNLGAYGDAGALGTNDAAFAKRTRTFANHGALIKHQHVMEGINSRLDGLQAAILSAKLPYILEWTAARQRVARNYDELLADIPQLTRPRVRPGNTHVYHLYVVEVDRREELVAFLASHGVETAVHYPTPLPLLPAYAHLGGNAEDFPVAVAKHTRILSLPIFPELTHEQQVHVAGVIREFYESR